MARYAGQVVIKNLREIEQDCSILIKDIPSRQPGESLEGYLVRVCGFTAENPFGNLLDATEEGVIWTRLNSWAAALAIRQSHHADPLPIQAYRMVGDLWEADRGAWFLKLLSDLEQAEAEADGILADPIIAIWIQEEVARARQDPPNPGGD